MFTRRFTGQKQPRDACAGLTAAKSGIFSIQIHVKRPQSAPNPALPGALTASPRALAIQRDEVRLTGIPAAKWVQFTTNSPDSRVGQRVLRGFGWVVHIVKSILKLS